MPSIRNPYEEIPVFILPQQPILLTLEGISPGQEVRAAFTVINPRIYQNRSFYEAFAALSDSNTNRLVGHVTFAQNADPEQDLAEKYHDSSEPVEIKIQMFEGVLEPNKKYGIHIHENLLESTDCTKAGAILNPYEKAHGGIDDEIRQAGDLGNLVVDTNQYGEIVDNQGLASLVGNFSILGNSIVIHELEDDLGTGDGDSFGNAGKFEFCGNIYASDPGVELEGFWYSENGKALYLFNLTEAKSKFSDFNLSLKLFDSDPVEIARRNL